MIDKTLIIFDFDFTIAKTVECVSVRSPRGNHKINNKTYRRIHPTELQQFGIADDEIFDENSYHEFYSLNMDKTKIIQPILPYIKYYSNYEYYILTARPQDLETKIKTLLQNNNINTDTLGFKGLKNSSYEKKINWIDYKIKKENYKKIILFEDNILMIEEAYKKYNNIESYYIKNLTDKTTITYKFRK